MAGIKLKSNIMLSRITIEVDFENGNMPIIQIMQMDSDDVRDKLVAVFLQSFGHTSGWGTIEFKNHVDDKDGYRHRWIIRPITLRQLAEVERPLMDATIKECLPIEKEIEGSAPNSIFHPQHGGYVPERFA